jgi:hypothetical protein
MKTNRLTLLVLSIAACAFVLHAEDSLAQVPPNLIYIDSSGAGGTIQISVDMDINGTLPPEWSGWVVDREAIGDCDQPTVQVGDVTPFPVGAQVFQLADSEALPELTYKYRFYAVDSDGVRHGVPHSPDFGFLVTTYASINDVGRVAVGYLVDLGWGIGLAVCPSGCWEQISSIYAPPPLFNVLVGSSTTVEIFGQIDVGVEGPYISSISNWSIVSDCSAVGNDRMTWGAAKAMYR